MELQRVRRQQAARRADSEDEDESGRGTLEDDAAVFGVPASGAAAAKRRKVQGQGEKKKGLDDPFGPPL